MESALSEFIELPVFPRRLNGRMTARELRRMQWSLALRPEQAPAVYGPIRKLRWRGEGRGKRGGLRVRYVYRPLAGRIFLLMVFAKNEADDLSPKQYAALMGALGED